MNYSMRPRTGFTLVEMLVVISILTILGGLVLTAISSARRTAKERATEATIKLLEAALMRYETDWQDYPPSEGDGEGLRGSENLYQYLRIEKKEGPYITSKDIQLSDVNKNGEMEIADAFNRPLLYFHHRDYANKAPNKRTFRLFSYGANGVNDDGRAGSDDLVNWNKDRPND
ncbi:MAG TPA: prepilin-type N-terminal cleavage/methylation domain-containing protein [Planctomycetota bacterium]|nr:prepilin-type N-terminal cleavage/methylation domain-containing protein [Planctomycetota bacterium]